jgi:twinkle protein
MIELAHRGIDKDVCRLFRYKQANITSLGGHCEVAEYILDGKLIAQHVRTKNKAFKWIGDRLEDPKTGKRKLVARPLWGQNLWRSKGKRIIITEGEIDAMSVYQIMGKKWPVVSLPNGASAAARDIRQSLEFLNGYDEIVLCFDQDKAGKEAALECAEILPPGKAKIVTMPYKDANAMLLKGETKALLNALWDAQTHRPDGIVHVSDVPDNDDINQQMWPYPWRDVTKHLVGQRSHEMVMWTSGTGMGKSTVLRHIVNDHLKHGRTVGVLMLEESIQETRDDLVSIMIEKPVRQIKAARKVNAALAAYDEEAIDFGIDDDLDEEEYNEAKIRLGKLPLYLYKHGGAKDYDGVTAKIEYMAVALGCDVVVLDHVTAVVAGTEYNGKGERRGIDELMGELRSLVSRTGVHLDVVSQLKKPEGKPFEEGAQISAMHLRGSGSLASVPNVIIAIERNQQDPDPERKNTVLLRVLKNRFFGFTGLAAALKWNPNTMDMEQVAWSESVDGRIEYGTDTEEYEDDDPIDGYLSTPADADSDTGSGTEHDSLQPEAGERGHSSVADGFV